MILIHPSVYGVDESKAEFKTFCHVFTDESGEEHADLYEYDGFKRLCIELDDGAKIFSAVMKAIQDKKNYLGFEEFGTEKYFEIQWD